MRSTRRCTTRTRSWRRSCVSERIDELFAEYASAYARGERPQAPEDLPRAGDPAGALAGGRIHALLGPAPAPAADEQTVSLFQAWRANESPLLRLRTARGLKRETVASMLVRALGLDPERESTGKGNYSEP